MARKRPPFVECWRDRHGRLRVYFRKGKGQRIALPSSIGSEEFDAAYQAALAGQIEAKHEQRKPAYPGTIAALINSYKRSAEYVGLRSTTKAGYVTRIEVLRIEHGQRSVAGLTRERIITGILQPYADRPGAALSILKMLRILIRHAINTGWLNTTRRWVSNVLKRMKFGRGPNLRFRHSRRSGQRALNSVLLLRSFSVPDSVAVTFDE
jgi:hypothetical protein